METLPEDHQAWWEQARKAVKGHERPVEDISKLIQHTGAVLTHETPALRVFRIPQKK